MTPKNMPPRIESDFYEQLPPLTGSELERLRENILSDGEVYEPIITWRGIILDGHNRWRVIRENWDKLKDKYHVKEMDFPDKYAAWDWMYRKQLGRRNLTKEHRDYLIGKMYEAEKRMRGGNHGNQYIKMASGPDVHLPEEDSLSNRTAEAIGKEFGITERSVRRAEKYSKGIDTLKEVSADAADKVLKGQSKATKAAIRELPEKDAGEIADIAEAIERGEPVPVKETPTGQGDPSQSVKSLVDEIELNGGAFLRSVQSMIEDRRTILTQDNVDDVISAIQRSIIEAFMRYLPALKDSLQPDAVLSADDAGERKEGAE